MAPAESPVLLGSPRRAPPGLARQLAPLLVAVGLAFCVTGAADLGLFFFPARFGDASWEFGTIAQLIDAAPTGILGTLLLTVGIRALDPRPQWTRALAVLWALVALLLLGMLVIFLMDLPVAYRFLTQRGPTPATPVEVAGIKRVIAKAFVLGLTYLGCYVTMALTLWRSRRAAPLTSE